MRTMNPSTAERWDKRRTSAVANALVYLNLLLLLLCAGALPSYGRIARQEQPRDALGPLTSLGEVYVNDAPIPLESTIFSGDRIRTGETGAATFTMSGKAALKISPRSQVMFYGNDQFTAELEAGTVVLNTIAGADGVVLRIGNYVVVSSVRELSATSRITRAPDGSFQVSCLEGKVEVLTLEGKSGQLLQAGQSLTISAKSDLLPTSPSAKPKSNFRKGLLALGVAGVGAAVAAVRLAHRGGNGNQTVSLPVP
jgi:ferric-dicitrate binding protein FerR (iron transport regulator)